MATPVPKSPKLFLKLLLASGGQSQDPSTGGFILIMAMVMVLFLSLLLLAYGVMSKVDTAVEDAAAQSQTGFYAAEAGLNFRAKTLGNSFQGYNRPSGTAPANFQACTDTSAANDGSGDFICDSQVFQGYLNVTYVSELPNNPTLITINQGEVYRGLSAQEYRYDVFSTSVDRENLPTTILTMRFKSRLVPLFQFAAFYDKDLEILVGADTVLNGPLHSNGDLYLNSNGNLTLNGQVTVSGALYRGRKHENTCTGNVRIYNLQNLTPLTCNGRRTQITDVDAWNGMIHLGNERLQLPAEGMLDPLPGSMYWDKADLRIVLRLNNSNNPVAIEIRNSDNSVDLHRTRSLLHSCTMSQTTLSVPPPNQNSNGADNNKIQVASTNGLAVGDVLTVGSDLDSNVISDINGNIITFRRKFAHPYQAELAAGVPVRKSVVSTSDTFYNYREGKYIRMLEVDLQELFNCVWQHNLLDGGKALNDSAEGGLVWYFTVEGPQSNIDMNGANPPRDGNNYGIRLRNGREIRSNVPDAPLPQGLTIVTNQAVYIRGSYNSVNKKPAAFLADTINVLSDNWRLDDSASRGYDGNNLPNLSTNLSSRTPTETTINAAFLAGTDTTGKQEGASGQDGGYYNGGLENYLRFHENWNNSVAVNYRGSLVSLHRPRKVDGPWCGTGGSMSGGCNMYNPPKLNWDYDTGFNNAANLPPLSPRFVYLKQEVFSRNFEQP